IPAVRPPDSMHVKAESPKSAPLKANSKTETETRANKFSAPRKGWFAQVAARRKQSDAQSMARKLSDAGFPVAMEVARVRGEQYFRVLVGPVTDRSRADKLVTQLKRESYINSDPFARLIK